MTDQPRVSALADRHRALGSGLEDWNGMGTAWSYASDPDDEHDAVREAAGLFDMSPLRKIMVRGRDAALAVDHLISRDARTIEPGRSAYCSVLSERGTLCDDAIVANLDENSWLVVHGTGSTMERLRESSEGRDVEVTLDDDLHDISLQGPNALPLLAGHTPLDLPALPYFQHRETELFGRPCRISRTGYSGERGYEIFADRAVVGELWDAILHHGAALGVRPCSFTALDKVRIEAGLLFFGYDMTEEHTPWEVGLGFTVSRRKRDFRGRRAVFASEGRERFRLIGLVADTDRPLTAGDRLLREDGKEAGRVTSPAYSRRMGRSLALAHVQPEAAAPNTVLEVEGDKRCLTRVTSIPFYDPGKARVRS